MKKHLLYSQPTKISQSVELLESLEIRSQKKKSINKQKGYKDYNTIEHHPLIIYEQLNYNRFRYNNDLNFSYKSMSFSITLSTFYKYSRIENPFTLLVQSNWWVELWLFTYRTYVSLSLCGKSVLSPFIVTLYKVSTTPFSQCFYDTSKTHLLVKDPTDLWIYSESKRMWLYLNHKKIDSVKPFYLTLLLSIPLQNLYDLYLSYL